MKTTRFLAAMGVLVLSCAGVSGAASKEPENSVPQDVFDGMRESFRPEKARNMHARYQWDLSGPNGGQWWIEIDNGNFKLGRGKIDKPNVSFVASDKTWVAISNGKLKGTWAVFTGRLKVHGDRNLARKLDEVCP